MTLRSNGFRLPLCLFKLLDTYERTQVELHGKYSVERVTNLYAFQQTYSAWVCVLILIATPLPCLAIIVLTDLVPLNSPTKGYTHNVVFFVRVFFVGFAITATLLEQARRFIPGLPLSTCTLWVYSTTVATTSTAYAYLMASVISFPIPFTVIVCSPCFLSTLAIIGWILWGNVLRRSPRIRREMVAYIKVMVIQFVLTLVYPAYNFAFIHLTRYEQTALALVLPLLKLLSKNAINAVFNPMLEDFKPEVIIFNVEVFHALFVSCCMQSSTSWTTTIALMGVDFVHSWFGVHDIDHLMHSIDLMQTKLRTAESSHHGEASTTTSSSLSLIEKAMYYAHHDEAVRRDTTIRFRTVATNSMASATVFPIVSLSTTSHAHDLEKSFQKIPLRRTVMPLTIPKDKRPNFGVLTPNERIEYVGKILQVLHMAEFLLLIEFVEVIVPVVYCVYLTAMFFLPNRIYYPQLVHMNTSSLLSTIGSTLGYASLEFVSFILLSIALRRKLEFSPVHQLAFVVRTQWNLVQSKLILWVVFSVHTALAHFGNP